MLVTSTTRSTNEVGALIAAWSGIVTSKSSPFIVYAVPQRHAAIPVWFGKSARSRRRIPLFQSLSTASCPSTLIGGTDAHAGHELINPLRSRALRSLSLDRRQAWSSESSPLQCLHPISKDLAKLPKQVVNGAFRQSQAICCSCHEPSLRSY